MSKTVLLVTATHETEATPRLAAALERQGHTPVVLHTDRYPSPAVQVGLAFPAGGSVTVDGARRPLEAFHAMWFRRLDPRPTVDASLAPSVRTEATRTLRGLLDTFPGRVIDRPRVVEAAHKTAQLRLAAGCGLRVPATVHTSDPDEARAFVAAHPDGVVAKMMHDVRLPGDASRTGATVFTNVLGPDDVAALDDLVWCPMTLQARVRAAAELRVIAVGDEVRAAALEERAGAVDWRRTGARDVGRWTPTALPDDVEAGVRALQAALGLQLGAYDLIRDDDGALWFLEVNPTGEWFWLDDVCGLGVADALAALLAR